MKGPGKYDEICSAAREMANAEGCVLIIYNGEHGHGFSAQLPKEQVATLVSVLREVIEEIEKDELGDGGSFTPIAKCPDCGYVMDSATVLGASAKPSPGDFTVCFKCGQVSVFDPKLNRRTATQAEIGALEPQQRKELDAAVAAIKHNLRKRG